MNMESRHREELFLLASIAVVIAGYPIVWSRAKWGNQLITDVGWVLFLLVVAWYLVAVAYKLRES